MTTLKIARELLDRFFRDAEGKTNRQLDVYFTLDDPSFGHDRTQPAVDFLVTRGLINMFGPDVAFLTDKGIRVAVEDLDLATLPQEMRDFSSAPPSTPEPSGRAEPPSNGRPTTRSTSVLGHPGPAATPRPDRATLTHIDLDGQEFALELGYVCSIGRADGNTIRISDKRASKNHAEIVYENSQFILRDLKSANGTLINGEYVIEPIILKHDDEIVIGRTMLLFTAPVEIPSPAEPTTVSEPAVFDPEPVSREAAAAAFRVIQGRPASILPGGSPVPKDGGTPVVTADLDPPPVGVGRAALPPSSHPAASPGGGRPAPRPGTDLFAKPPERVRRDDLFDSGAGDDALFESGAIPQSADAVVYGQGLKAADIFDSPSARPAADHDLFPSGAPNTAARSARMTAEPIHPTTSGAGLELAPLAEGLQGDLHEPLEEIEPFESLDDEPDSGWAQDTPAGAAPLLANQPVIHAGEAPPTMPEEATMAQPQTDDMATLMVSREDLFGDEAGRTEDDPPRWGDAEDIHPAFGEDARAKDPAAHSPLGQVQASAEELPVADVALATWQPPRAPSTTVPAVTTTVRDPAEPFFQTLQVLKARLATVDVPEKGALLEAVEVLSQHPYVRVVLESLPDKDR